MQHLLVLDRRDSAPCPMEEMGQKGAAKPCRVPTAGVIISRAALNVADCGHHCKAELPEDVWRDNESAAVMPGPA
jgi:hypothetical protein